jgi:TRAP-type C4-dicarboxylate transport system permease small subunit
MNIPIFSSSWSNCTDKSIPGQEVATLNCVSTVLGNVINAFVVFAGVVALILLIWGGIKYINSRGDAQAIDGAKKTITWAIIGLVFIAFSFAILQLIKSLTGANF